MVMQIKLVVKTYHLGRGGGVVKTVVGKKIH